MKPSAKRKPMTNAGRLRGVARSVTSSSPLMERVNDVSLGTASVSVAPGSAPRTESASTSANPLLESSSPPPKTVSRFSKRLLVGSSAVGLRNHHRFAQILSTVWTGFYFIFHLALTIHTSSHNATPREVTERRTRLSLYARCHSPQTPRRQQSPPT